MDAEIDMLLSKLNKQYESDVSESTKNQKLERDYRECRNELSLKKNQVIQMREELEEANLKNFELNKKLEKSKLEMKQIEFDLVTKSKETNSLESELKDLKTSFKDLQLNEDIRTAEIDALNDYSSRILKEKNELRQKVDEVESQCMIYSGLQEEFTQHCTKMKKGLDETKTIVDKLRVEQQAVLNLGSQVSSIQNCNAKCHFLSNSLKALQVKYNHLEGEFIRMSAKCSKLEELLQRPDHISATTNLETKLIFASWEEAITKYEETINHNKNKINKLYDELKEEKEMNGKLIKLYEDSERKLEEVKNINYDLKASIKIKKEKGTSPIVVD